MTKKQSKLTSFFTAGAASPSVKSRSAKKQKKEVEEPPVESPPADSPESETASVQSPPIPLYTQLRKLEVDTEDDDHRGKNAKYLYGFVTAWDAASGTFSVDFMDSADIDTKVGEETGLTLDQVKRMIYLDSIIGTNVRKDFDSGPYEGVIVDIFEDADDGGTLYHVYYEDEEEEDLDEKEFQDCREYYSQFHKKKSPFKTSTTTATSKTKDVASKGKRSRRKPANYAEPEDDDDDDDDEDEDFKKPPAKKKRIVKKHLFPDSSDEEMDFKPPDSEDDADLDGSDLGGMSDGDDAGNGDNNMPEDSNQDDREDDQDELGGGDEGTLHYE
jgi:hypothetical protein